MTVERYRLLGLAHARSAWFRDLSRWANNASLPVEFVKCMALEELHARLASGRPFSAVIADGGLTGVDRDLVDRAREAGVAVLVVDDGRRRVDWRALGADAVLPESFDRGLLLSTLLARATALDGPDGDGGSRRSPPPPGWRGRLVAVTGPGGAGTSTTAMALAQGLGSASRHQGLVVLADLALHADLALLHDAGDVVPGVQELVEAHRTETLTVDQVRSFAFRPDGRGYDLVLGLRRHRDWPVLRSRAVHASIDGLLRSYRLVVADIDPDVEGDDEVGSVDVEERNQLARATVGRADLILVTAPPTVTGIRRLVLTIDELGRSGIPGSRLLPVITRSPRRARARSEITRAVGELVTRLGVDATAGMPSPLFLPDRRGLDDIHRAAGLLPIALVRPVTEAVEAILDRAPLVPDTLDAAGPVPVVAGTLGAWSEDESAS